MEVVAQTGIKKATFAGKAEGGRGYTLRVRLSESEKYEWSEICREQQKTDSATFRWLVSRYKLVKLAEQAALAIDAEQEAVKKREAVVLELRHKLG